MGNQYAFANAVEHGGNGIGHHVQIICADIGRDLVQKLVQTGSIFGELPACKQVREDAHAEVFKSELVVGQHGRVVGDSAVARASASGLI